MTSRACLGCSVAGSTWFLGRERTLCQPELDLSYPILCHLHSTAGRCSYVSVFSCSFCRHLNQTGQKCTGPRTVSWCPSLRRGSLNSSLPCCPGVRLKPQPPRARSMSQLCSLLTSRRHRVGPSPEPWVRARGGGVCSTHRCWSGSGFPGRGAAGRHFTVTTEAHGERACDLCAADVLPHHGTWLCARACVRADVCWGPRSAPAARAAPAVSAYPYGSGPEPAVGKSVRGQCCWPAYGMLGMGRLSCQRSEGLG